MGRIITASPASLRPTQDYLTQSIIDYYLGQRKDSKPLPPIPVCKSLICPGMYDILDGHHNSAAAALVSEGCALWVADGQEDFMSYDKFPLVHKDVIDVLNSMTERRFVFVHSYVPLDRECGEILTLDRLMEYRGIVSR